MKTIRYIIINIITFAILLVAVNWLCGRYLKSATRGVARHELPNYQNDPDYAKLIFGDYARVQHEYEPFVGWRMKPYSGETLHVGTDGLRVTPAPTTNQPARVVRFFGGSTMWGEGADDEHTIPAIFGKNNPHYEIVNHAQLAFNSRQELDELISAYTAGKKADIVIFYDGVNDAAFLCPDDITELPAHRLVPMYREKLYTGESAVVKDILARLFVKNILRVIHRWTYKPSDENAPYDCLRNPEKAEQIAEIMIKNWEMAHEMVTARGGDFIAILQPAAFVGQPRTDHLELDETLGDNFREIYRRLKEKIAARKHPWIVDLSDRFDGDEYIFIDFCHVSPNGNEIIAGEITSLVRNLENQHVAVSYVHP